MKNTGAFSVPGQLLLLLLAFALLFPGCSKDLPPYEDLVESGTLEATVRKEHADFFKAIDRFREAALKAKPADPDSLDIKKAAGATDIIVNAMLPFPATVDSRIALDAVAFAAGDLATEENMTIPILNNFRDSALLQPLFSLANQLTVAGNINDSAHLQLVKALKNGMGEFATEEMLVNCLTVVGLTPSEKVLAVCEEDTLVFKRVHDLLLYSRSLQTIDPPIWLLSGPWFTVFKFEGYQPRFFAIVPVMVEDVPFLAFRGYTPGEVYAAVYDDPVPREKEKWTSWLSRGDAVMKNITFDRIFAENVKDCGIPTYNAHHFFNEYILHAFADTTAKEFMISLKKGRVEDSAFNFTGMDSLTVIFSGPQAMEPDPNITVLKATRTIGNSMQGGKYFPGTTIEGKAYLMQMGTHTRTLIDAYEKKIMPQITVNKVPATQ